MKKFIIFSSMILFVSVYAQPLTKDEVKQVEDYISKNNNEKATKLRNNLAQYKYLTERKGEVYIKSGRPTAETTKAKKSFEVFLNRPAGQIRKLLNNN